MTEIIGVVCHFNISRTCQTASYEKLIGIIRHCQSISGRVYRVSVTETVDTSLIPNRIKLKTIKNGVQNFNA